MAVSSLGITSIANEGSGQGLFDSTTGGVASFYSLVSSDSTIAIGSPSAGTISLTVDQGDLNLNNLSGVLDVTSGGTGLSSIAANNILYTSATNTLAATPFTSLALSLVGDATTADMQSTLGLVIGTNVQAQSSSLSSIAALNSVGFVVQTGANSFADRTLTTTANAGLSISNSGLQTVVHDETVCCQPTGAARLSSVNRQPRLDGPEEDERPTANQDLPDRPLTGWPTVRSTYRGNPIEP